MDKGVWEEAVRKDVDEEGMESRNRCKRGVCSEEGKSVSIVERRGRGGEGVCEGTVKKVIHSAIQVTTNGAGILCRKERWEEENGTGLQILK